jgi:hypothetical protein
MSSRVQWVMLEVLEMKEEGFFRAHAFVEIGRERISVAAYGRSDERARAMALRALAQEILKAFPEKP